MHASDLKAPCGAGGGSLRGSTGTEFDDMGGVDEEEGYGVEGASCVGSSPFFSLAFRFAFFSSRARW